MSECQKVRHASEFDAASHAIALARHGKTGTTINVYLCDECRAFHWGHWRGRRKDAGSEWERRKGVLSTTPADR